MQTELLIYVIVKALLELAAMFLFGQGMLYLLSGQRRDQNWFYNLFKVLTGPIVKFARFITPNMVLDRHIPYVAFLMVAWAWVILVFWVLPEMCGSGTVDCTQLIQRKTQH